MLGKLLEEGARSLDLYSFFELHIVSKRLLFIGVEAAVDNQF